MIEIIRYPIDREINSQKLEAVFTYKKNFGIDIGNISVQLPKSYTSIFSTMIEKDEEDFASVTFNYSKASGLYIENFSTAVNDPTYRFVATEEEINISKGLGKYIMCLLLTILLSKQIVRKDTKVSLEAVPYLSCNFDKDSKIKLYYEKYTTAEAITKLEKFPDLYAIVMEEISNLDSEEIRRKLIISLCKLEHLISLVSYYKKLGFRSSTATENYTFSLKMHSDVYSILINCQRI
jgi:hypothetical protein